MSLPYHRATSGEAALGEVRKVLVAYGCTAFAPAENFETGEISISFINRGREVRVTASAQGYARALMARPPQKGKARWTEESALKQGRIAVWSVLRDWIKGQLTAVECGIMPFEAAFLGQMVLTDGSTGIRHAEDYGLLPPPDGVKRIGGPA